MLKEIASLLLLPLFAVGVDGLFMEVHPEPEKALCDGPNMMRLEEVGGC